MPVHAQLPDGTLLEFPDNTPDAVINGTVQKHLSTNQQPNVADDMRGNAEMNTATHPGAALTAYAANAMQAIPFSDEIGSALASTAGFGQGNSWKERYDNMQASQQALREAGQKNYPGASLTGELGAGLATSAVAPTLKVAKGATTLGTLLRDAGVGAVNGLGYGAAYGLGQGDATKTDEQSQEERLGNAGKLGSLSAAIGAAIPGIAQITPMASKLAGLVGSGLKAVVGAEVPPETIAAKQLSNLMQRDNLSFGDIPVNQNLLQAGGRAATARAEAITTRGNQPADNIVNFADQRKLELPTELSDFLGKKFEDTNYPAMLDAIKQKAYAEAEPGYEAAYNAVTRINDPQINQNLTNIAAAGDWPVLSNEARKMAAYEGRTLPTLEDIEKSGKPVISESSIIGTDGQPIKKVTFNPDVNFSTQDLDYMTRALRNLGQATEGMGAMGGRTPIGAMRQNNAMAIRSRLGELNPAFKDVTSQYADDVGIYKAAQEGKSVNLMGSNAKQAIYDYQNLSSPMAQKAWRLGQAENLQNMIARNPQAALRQFNTPQFKKVMQNFYSDAEYQTLIDKLTDRASEAAKLQQITGNSRTAARQIQQTDDASLAENAPAGEFVNDLMRSGVHHTAINYVADMIGKKLFNTPNTDKIMSNLLLSTPFNMASQAATGQMPHQILAELLKTPNQNGPTKSAAALAAALQSYRLGQSVNAAPLLAAGTNN